MGVQGADEQLPEPLLDLPAVAARVKRFRTILLRRWLRVLGTATVLVAIAAALTRVWPRSYSAGATVFALPADGAAGSQRGPAGETIGLTQGAAELSVSRVAEREMVRKLGLAVHWEEAEHRGISPYMARVAALFGTNEATTPEQRAVDALDERLRLKVKGPEVTVSVDWPDPDDAYALVNETVERLIADRHKLELAPLEAKAETLRARVETEHQRMQRELALLEAQIVEKRKGARPSTVRGLQAQGRFGDLPDPRLSELRQKILTQRKAIAELEDVQDKRQANLQALLAEQRATLGPQNPQVLDTQDKLNAVERQRARVDQLKDDEQQLLAEYVRNGGNERELSPEAGPLWAPELKDDDEGLAFRRAALASDLSRLDALRAQAIDADVAVGTARAAFDGHYAELVPPKRPTHPASPKTVLICLAALVAGLFLGAFSALVDESAAPVPGLEVRRA
jgi:uncharacterized protein involved in exopolysaccharide biosynthesis